MAFLIRFLFKNLKGLRWLVLLAMLVSITQVASDLGAAYPIKFITSKVSNPGNDPSCTFPFLGTGTPGDTGVLGLFDTPVLDKSLIQGPTVASQCPAIPGDLNSIEHPIRTQHSVIGVIVFSVILLILLATISAILGYFDLFIASFLAQSLSARLRTTLFEHLQRISLDWHGKQKKGDLVQRITSNIADIEKLVTDGLVDILVGSLTLIGVLALMLRISWQYTILSLAIAPFLFMTIIYYTRNIKAATKRAAKAAGQVADVAVEDINALTVIKVFTREEREDKRFGERVIQTRRAGLLAGFLQAQFAPIVAILLAIGTAVIIGVGGYVAAGNPFFLGPVQFIGAGAVDVGTLVLFLLFLKVLFQPMKDLAKLLGLASVATSGAERIQEVLDQAPELVETTAPYYGPRKLKGEITFENVVFSYSKDRPVLKGINLHIPAGRKVGLVGLSGGGKTTLVKLIPRFYEPTSGSVKLDGADNRLYPLSVCRENVSMVLQDSVLFEGTVRENIELGRPGASEEDIIDAAKKAQIHETIMNFPDGYNTYVREQGKNFSGGQRQRLAIARAILRDSPILILDEPTASLDVEAEAEVMNALDKLIVGRTVLVISHRLGTLGNVDEIIVLSGGQIIEKGSYKELKRAGGVFAGLLEEQNRYSAEEANKSILRSAFAPLPIDYDVRQVPPSPMGPQHRSTPPSAPARPTPLPPPVRPVPVPVAPGDNGSAQRPSTDGDRQAQLLRTARVLIEVDGKVVGERRLDKPLLTVGRLSSSDVQIPSQRVSRLHARIHSVNGVWLMEDADSTNGILYQGQRVDNHELRNGDQITLAPKVILRFESV